MKVSDLVYENILPLFKGELKLVEVEYTKKNDGMHLIVYIDKEGGVSIDDCVEVNHLIDPILEELNPTNDAKYVLDVSSYGLDKPLKYDWQFKRYQNKEVDVKLYRKLNSLKEFTATLISNDNDKKAVQFKLNDEIITIQSVDIAYITPHIEF